MLSRNYATKPFQGVNAALSIGNCLAGRRRAQDIESRDIARRISNGTRAGPDRCECLVIVRLERFRPSLDISFRELLESLLDGIDRRVRVLAKIREGRPPSLERGSHDACVGRNRQEQIAAILCCHVLLLTTGDQLMDGAVRRLPSFDHRPKFH
ncbi:hypothetical protein [Sphingomonas sp. UYP23]